MLLDYINKVSPEENTLKRCPSQTRNEPDGKRLKTLNDNQENVTNKNEFGKFI